MKIAVVLGTRPEIIKMSPVIRELEKRSADYFILHSGQHYSYNMDRVFSNNWPSHYRNTTLTQVPENTGSRRAKS